MKTKIPRPMGVTELILKGERRKAQEIIVKLFLQAPSLIPNPDLKEYLNLTHPQTQKLINQTIKKQSINQKEYNVLLNVDNQEINIQECLNQALIMSMSDRGQIMNQIAIHQIAQKGKYVPFISSGLNNLLGTLLASQLRYLETIKTYMPKSQNGNVNISLNQTQNLANNSTYLTAEKAIQMISQMPEMAPEKKVQYLKAQEAKTIGPTIPSVVEYVGDEGNNVQAWEAHLNGKNENTLFDPNHHTDRRTLELGPDQTKMP